MFLNIYIFLFYTFSDVSFSHLYHFITHSNNQHTHLRVSKVSSRQVRFFNILPEVAPDDGVSYNDV